MPPARIRFHRDNQVAVAECQGLVHGLGQARTHLRLVFQTVDDDLDVMLDALVELQVVGEFDDLTVHAGADVTALPHVGEEILELALLAADDRREDHEPRTF